MITESGGAMVDTSVWPILEDEAAKATLAARAGDAGTQGPGPIDAPPAQWRDLACRLRHAQSAFSDSLGRYVEL